MLALGCNTVRASDRRRMLYLVGCEWICAELRIAITGPAPALRRFMIFDLTHKGCPKNDAAHNFALH